jgi:hypothetical protein
LVPRAAIYQVLCINLITFTQGLSASVTLKNSERYSGIFSQAVPASSPTRYVLKMTRKLNSANKQANGVADELVGSGEEHTMEFEIANVLDLGLEKVSFDKSRAAAQNGTFYMPAF